MKVLFIEPYLSFSFAESDKLIGSLARKGHEVDIILYLRDKKKKLLLPKDVKINVHLANALSLSIPHYISEFPYFLSLETMIKNINPDIIHIYNLPFLTTFQSVKIAKKLSIPSIVHVHGVMGERGFLFNLAQKIYLFTFGHSIFRNADKIICLTMNNAIDICKFGCSPSKISIIPNGVDVKQFHPINGEVPGFLLWCGRFVREKGLKYLIEAIKLIVSDKKNQHIKLVLLGDGLLQPMIRGMVKKYHLEKNIIFSNRLRHEEIPTIINKASIYVLPSLQEGMPYVLLEAMACGKAVIGSDISGINDVITHEVNGLLVPPRNAKALNDAILKLLNNKKLREKLGLNARQLMIEKYSWTAIRKKVEKLYDKTILDINQNLIN